MEGAVGAGTGMSCLGFKGGIGTASRITAEGHTVAVLLLTNFGVRRGPDRRRRAARPAAARRRPTAPPMPAGSCLGVVVTDAPVDGASCARLARRVGLGLARTGSVAHHGSGEIFLALGTGLRLDRDQRPDGVPPDRPGLDPLFPAVVEAAEEAVLNSMLTAPTTVGRDGNVSESLHSPEVLALLGGGPVTGTSTTCGSRSATGPRSPRRCTCRTPPPGRSRACSRRCPTARTT